MCARVHVGCLKCVRVNVNGQFNFKPIPRFSNRNVIEFREKRELEKRTKLFSSDLQIEMLPFSFWIENYLNGCLPSSNLKSFGNLTFQRFKFF